jgi:hypothetical protein
LGYENISSNVETMENETSSISLLKNLDFFGHINPGNKNEGCTH